MVLGKNGMVLSGGDDFTVADRYAASRHIFHAGHVRPYQRRLEHITINGQVLTCRCVRNISIAIEAYHGATSKCLCLQILYYYNTLCM